MTTREAFNAWLQGDEGQATLVDLGCDTYDNPVVVKRLALCFIAGATHGVNETSEAILDQLRKSGKTPPPHNADTA